MEPFSKLAEFVPFLLTAGKHPKLNIARAIESALIAVMVAGALKLFAIDALKAEVQVLSQQVNTLGVDIKEMRRDLYIPKGGK